MPGRGDQLVAKATHAAGRSDDGGSADASTPMHGPAERGVVDESRRDGKKASRGSAGGQGQGERLLSMKRDFWVIGTMSVEANMPGEGDVRYTGGHLAFLAVSTLQTTQPKIFFHDMQDSSVNTRREVLINARILVADPATGDGNTLVLRGSSPPTSHQGSGKSWTVKITVDGGDVANLALLKRFREFFREKPERYAKHPELFNAVSNSNPGKEVHDLLKIYLKKKEKQKPPSRDVSRLGSNRGASMLAATKNPEVIREYKRNTEAKRSNLVDTGAYHTPPEKSSLLPAWVQEVKRSRTFGGSGRNHAALQFQRSSQQVTNLQGFRNLGNTCYMNAIASVLVALPSLVADIEEFSSSLPAGHPKTPFTSALLSLCKASSSTGHGVLDMGLFKSAISARAKRFAGREQQDAHEFLTICMDVLGEEISGTLKDGEAKRAVTADNMGISIKHTLRCEGGEGGCGYGRGKTESFLDMSLCIPSADKPLSLPHLVEAFFADSHLEYTCEKCGHGQANAKHKMKQLPRYMVVHLKRFQPNWEKGTYEKSFTSVSLPETIDMAPYCSSKTAPPRTPHPSALAALPRAVAGPDQARSTSPLATPANSRKTPGTPSSHELSLNDTVQAVSSSSTPSSVKLESPSSRRADLDAVPRKLQFDKTGVEKIPGTPGKSRVLLDGISSDSFYSSGSGSSSSSVFGAPNRTSSKKRHFGGMSRGGTPGSALAKKARFAFEESSEESHSARAQKREDALAQEREQLDRALTKSLMDFTGDEAVGQIFDASAYSLGDEDDDLRRALELSAAHDRAAAAAEEEEEEATGAGADEAKAKHDGGGVRVIVEDDEKNNVIEVGGDDCAAGGGSVAVEDNASAGGADAGAVTPTYDDGVCEAANSQQMVVVDDVAVEDEGKQGRVEPQMAVEEEEEEEKEEEEEPDTDDEGMSENVCPAGYRLVSVVSHTGSSASSGHYVSDIRNAKTRLWRRFDDSVVTTLGERIPEEEARRWRRNAYIAVYAHDSCFAE